MRAGYEVVDFGVDLAPAEIARRCAARGDLCALGVSCTVTDARDGCRDCPEDRGTACPLENGWERRLDLEESRALVASYDKAQLLEAAPPEEGDHGAVLRLWMAQAEVIRRLGEGYAETRASRFPTSCPFCPPRQCVGAAACRHPEHYRPLHESWNIDMATTATTVRADIGNRIYALVLLRGLTR